MRAAHGLLFSIGMRLYVRDAPYVGLQTSLLSSLPLLNFPNAEPIIGPPLVCTYSEQDYSYSQLDWSTYSHSHKLPHINTTHT